MPMVGLNLAECVRDIITHIVEPDDVGVIVSTSSCSNEQDWNKLMSSYATNRWHPDPVAAIDLVRDLRAAGKIIQIQGHPRAGHTGKRKHWIDPS
jgi:hypothetical protein